MSVHCLPTSLFSESSTFVWIRCIEVIRSLLPITPPNIPEVILCKFISHCVCNNSFIFNGKVYVQKDEVAIGSSLGPVLANIWMSHLQDQHLLVADSVPLPVFYRRYADVIFCLFKSLEDANTYLQFINSVDGPHPTVRYRGRNRTVATFFGHSSITHQWAIVPRHIIICQAI